MTIDENFPKPEHGTIQAQDVHEIEKESETDSAEKQNSFPPALIAVQTIRTALEFMLVMPLLPLLTIGLGGFLLFLPFGLHFILQAVAWSRAKKETRIAWIVGINIYSLMIVAPIGAFYTWFMMKLQVAAPDITGVDIGLLWWFLGACVLEAVISIVMIVVMNVIKRNDLRDFQGKRITVAKPRIYADTLHGSQGRVYELVDDSTPLKEHRKDLSVENPRQHVNVRSQKKD
ncbi:hypothetical protein HMPREF2609_10460 [Rothia sp. HMSC058E10]|uniref:hypothetical protein n=1 Tax=unclassified Rothia (in: high G+C Gram-positive bacteria) TaxID=2689056 RepID=UPI0008A43764|nr:MULTISPECIES: hypothetical protein [unclassified Rothia (in: high G+C Gram-positive bacteria)]OFN14822.1 hypothetical protein HMPREF2609_10460 [Rothia sp. HMSC058E10]OFQ07298.1 hypothetical protein HMPREF2958_07870 [Rothia sp. HMSC036D11]